jgi:hypothetical protein
MRIEKWTLGLAALGLVTLAPALLAQNAAPQLVPLQTALSATTISGYVDTSAVWNPGTGNANPAPYAFNHGKQDGFNLDAADVKIAKPLEEGQWTAGYTLELSYGPDAKDIDSGAYPIRQAFVTMRVPVGNGLDFQLGRWDNLLGYEGSDSYKNPNYTRSYGYTIEPTEHTGLLASYKVCDAVNLQAGVADTLTTGGVNDRGTIIESKKAVVTLVTLTAPDSWGFLKGSALYGGFDHGSGASTHDQTEWYAGATINTPVKDLSVGGALDIDQHLDLGGVDQGYIYTLAGYLSFKVTDKLTLNGRAEWADGDALGTLSTGLDPVGDAKLHKVLAFTGTVQYDLWANVISRLEVRWDHAANGGEAFGGDSATGFAPDKKNEVMVAANVIYKF